jgi:hypothetical protein
MSDPRPPTPEEYERRLNGDIIHEHDRHDKPINRLVWLSVFVTLGVAIICALTLWIQLGTSSGVNAQNLSDRVAQCRSGVVAEVDEVVAIREERRIHLEQAIARALKALADDNDMAFAQATQGMPKIIDEIESAQARVRTAVAHRTKANADSLNKREFIREYCD